MREEGGEVGIVHLWLQCILSSDQEKVHQPKKRQDCANYEAKMVGTCFFVNRDPIWHSVYDVNVKAGTLLATRFVTIQDDLASCLSCIAGSVTKTSQQVCMSVVRSCVGL